MSAPATRALVVTLLGASCVLPVGCGKRGDPQAPLRRNPPPVLDLAVAQRGPRVEVTFTVPAVSVDGVRLEVLDVDLFWAEREGDFRKVSTRRTIRAAAGERLVLDEPAPPVGTSTRVAVRTRGGRHESALSPIALLPTAHVPSAPRDLTAEWTAEGVRLRWTGEIPPSSASPSPAAQTPPLLPSASSSPGAATSPPAQASGFVVYRRDPGAKRWAPLNKEPLTDPTYEDRAAPPAGTSCYVVVTAVSLTPWVESSRSSEVCLEPVP